MFIFLFIFDRKRDFWVREQINYLFINDFSIGYYVLIFYRAVDESYMFFSIIGICFIGEESGIYEFQSFFSVVVLDVYFFFGEGGGKILNF